MYKRGKKIGAREKNKIRIRKRISGTDERPRISVFRSSKHTYAQLVSDQSGKTIASASTLDNEVMEAAKSIKIEAPTNDSRSSKSVAAARAVGVVLAKRCKEHQLSQVIFDRNGFLYSGRIKAVAEGAREGGLEF